MRKLLYALLVGLVGAGVVHIAVVLLVPSFSVRDAWSRLADRGERNRFVRIDPQAGAGSPLASADPLFSVAACRFDLAEGPIHVRAEGAVPFWSVSVYDRSGQNVYSFNDRISAGTLDFAVLTSTQTIDIRKELPEELERSIFVEAPVDEGIVVVRAFEPDPSWSRIVSAFVDGMTCNPI